MSVGFNQKSIFYPFVQEGESKQWFVRFLTEPIPENIEALFSYTALKCHDKPSYLEILQQSPHRCGKAKLIRRNEETIYECRPNPSCRNFTVIRNWQYVATDKIGVDPKQKTTESPENKEQKSAREEREKVSRIFALARAASRDHSLLDADSTYLTERNRSFQFEKNPSITQIQERSR